MDLYCECNWGHLKRSLWMSEGDCFIYSLLSQIYITQRDLKSWRSLLSLTEEVWDMPSTAAWRWQCDVKKILFMWWKSSTDTDQKSCPGPTRCIATSRHVVFPSAYLPIQVLSRHSLICRNDNAHDQDENRLGFVIQISCLSGLDEVARRIFIKKWLLRSKPLPGSPTNNKWDSPRTRMPEESIRWTPPMSARATASFTAYKP